MHYDIFCKIVDNYGDIGVCWRLAKQLANEHGLQVRLLVDDFTVAAKIIPRLSVNNVPQQIDNIEILSIQNKNIYPAQVVLETFSCGLPEAYLQQMTQAKSRWINLDYLSAENWVSDFHAKPSPHPTLPLTKYFFFPGFTQQTGGLIRERDLLVKRDAFQANTMAQAEFWQQLGITNLPENALKISLFCYARADVAGLLAALKTHSEPAHLFVPDNPLLADFNTLLSTQTQQITVHKLPFLSQADYDQLLWVCDLNFVRGEDSWIRAIWAGKPFIWQPYYQTGNTHLVKLEAFINMYYKTFEQKQMVWKAHADWLAGYGFGSVCPNYIKNLKNTAIFSRQKSAELARQVDLASNLIAFANSKTTV